MISQKILSLIALTGALFTFPLHAEQTTSLRGFKNRNQGISIRGLPADKGGVSDVGNAGDMQTKLFFDTLQEILKRLWLRPQLKQPGSNRLLIDFGTFDTEMNHLQPLWTQSRLWVLDPKTGEKKYTQAKNYPENLLAKHLLLSKKELLKNFEPEYAAYIENLKKQNISFPRGPVVVLNENYWNNPKAISTSAKSADRLRVELVMHETLEIYWSMLYGYEDLLKEERDSFKWSTYLCDLFFEEKTPSLIQKLQDDFKGDFYSAPKMDDLAETRWSCEKNYASLEISPVSNLTNSESNVSYHFEKDPSSRFRLTNSARNQEFGKNYLGERELGNVYFLGSQSLENVSGSSLSDSIRISKDGHQLLVELTEKSDGGLSGYVHFLNVGILPKASYQKDRSVVAYLICAKDALEAK